MTYSTLKTLVANYLDREDLTSSVPNFVTSAQRKIERGDPIGIDRPIISKGDFKCMKAYATGALTSGSAYLTLPARYKTTQAFYVVSNSEYKLLNKKSLRAALTMFPDLSNDKDTPSIFATDDANSRFVLRATPDSAYTYHLYYFNYLSELSADGDTNWWTDNAWEMLLYGALMQAEPFMRNDPRIETWAGMLEQSIQGLMRSELKEESGGGYSEPSSLYVV